MLGFIVCVLSLILFCSRFILYSLLVIAGAVFLFIFLDFLTFFATSVDSIPFCCACACACACVHSEYAMDETTHARPLEHTK